MRVSSTFDGMKGAYIVVAVGWEILPTAWIDFAMQAKRSVQQLRN
jgi:hypothetical protein